jgi:hypothetical protein
MSVVAFKVAQDDYPVLTTIFCVRSYWSDRTKLVEGKLEQFGSVEMALRAGKIAARRSPFVRVYRVRGDVEADYWEEPMTLASFGSLAAPP